jgi:hypothetical protein
MPEKLDAATISVITSGCVAIAVIVFPLLISLISENLRWSREKKAAEVERVERVTKALMDAYSDFWSRNYDQLGGPAKSEREDLRQLHSRLLSCLYEWERIIWKRCNKADQATIRRIRQVYEDEKSLVTPKYLQIEYRTALSSDIHEITYNVIAKI